MSDFGVVASELVTAADAGAMEAVAAQAAERLAGVCAGWPDDRFRALVLDVARVRLHFGIPQAEYESLCREFAMRARATHHDLVHPPPRSDAPVLLERAAAADPPAPEQPADLRPTVQLPPASRGFPAFLDRPASAPT